MDQLPMRDKPMDGARQAVWVWVVLLGGLLLLLSWIFRFPWG
jgi:hypothetical protein